MSKVDQYFSSLYQFHPNLDATVRTVVPIQLHFLLYLLYFSSKRNFSLKNKIRKPVYMRDSKSSHYSADIFAISVLRHQTLFETYQTSIDIQASIFFC